MSLLSMLLLSYNAASLAIGARERVVIIDRSEARWARI